MRRWIRSFLGREEGTASVEFVVMFPMVILLFSCAFEAGMIGIRQAMLERATNESVRALRINQTDPPSYAELQQSICDAAVIIPDCTNSVQIEMTKVDTDDWNLDMDPLACIDRDNGYTPDEIYNYGDDNEIMMVRVCAVFEPVFPTAGLGAQLSRVNESDYALVTTTLFVNEPTK